MNDDVSADAYTLQSVYDMVATFDPVAFKITISLTTQGTLRTPYEIKLVTPLQTCDDVSFAYDLGCQSLGKQRYDLVLDILDCGEQNVNGACPYRICTNHDSVQQSVLQYPRIIFPPDNPFTFPPFSPPPSLFPSSFAPAPPPSAPPPPLPSPPPPPPPSPSPPPPSPYPPSKYMRMYLEPCCGDCDGTGFFQEQELKPLAQQFEPYVDMNEAIFKCFAWVMYFGSNNLVYPMNSISVAPTNQCRCMPEPHYPDPQRNYIEFDPSLSDLEFYEIYYLLSTGSNIYFYKTSVHCGTSISILLPHSTCL